MASTTPMIVGYYDFLFPIGVVIFLLAVPFWRFIFDSFFSRKNGSLF